MGPVPIYYDIVKIYIAFILNVTGGENETLRQRGSFCDNKRSSAQS
jgi:hypothetical protein